MIGHVCSCPSCRVSTTEAHKQLFFFVNDQSDWPSVTGLFFGPSISCSDPLAATVCAHRKELKMAPAGDLFLTRFT